MRGLPSAALPQSECGWAKVHREIETALVAVRRPRPEFASAPPGSRWPRGRQGTRCVVWGRA